MIKWWIMFVIALILALVYRLLCRVVGMDSPMLALDVRILVITAVKGVYVGGRRILRSRGENDTFNP